MNTKNYRNHTTSTKGNFGLNSFVDMFYENEDAQRQVFMDFKYPNGFACPECGHTEYRWLSTRNTFQCKCCYHQNFLFAGTVFQDSKLPLYKMLLGIYLFVQSQAGISGTDLADNLEINVNSARLFLRKLRVACKVENDEIKLTNLIDFDGGYLGGVDTGGKRGLGSKKQTILVGVEVVSNQDKTKEYPRQSLCRTC